MYDFLLVFYSEVEVKPLYSCTAVEVSRNVSRQEERQQEQRRACQSLFGRFRYTRRLMTQLK